MGKCLGKSQKQCQRQHPITQGFSGFKHECGYLCTLLLTQYLFVHQAWCSSSDTWLISLQARRDQTKAYTINSAQWRAKLQSRQTIPKGKSLKRVGIFHLMRKCPAQAGGCPGG